jgi:hypothetical protein
LSAEPRPGPAHHSKLLMGAGIAWVGVVVAAYANLLARLPSQNLSETFAALKGFILWQMLGFLVLGVSTLKAGGRTSDRFVAAYLVLSSVGLIACARDVGFALDFAAFATWAALAVLSSRLLLRRMAGPILATWGIAATFVFAALIPAAFLLGMLRLVHTAVIWTFGVAIAVPGLVSLARSRRGGRGRCLTQNRLGPVGFVSLEAVWLILAVDFVWASVPEVASDSSRVYIPFARELAFAHGFEIQGIDWHRLMPMAVQAVWGDAFAIGGVRLAKWLSWAALVALAVLVGEEVSKRGRSRTFGAFSAAAILACPLLDWLAGTLYIDHVLVLLAVGAFIALGRSLARNSRRAAIAAAVLAAALAQAKYTGAVLTVSWALALVVYAWRRGGLHGGLRWAAPTLLVLAALALPWYGYTYATTSDPVFPFAKNLFPSPYWPGEVATTLGQERFAGPGSVVGWLALPWQVTFHSSKFSLWPDGFLGLSLLAFLPLALTGRGPRNTDTTAFAAVAFFAVLAPWSLNLRYLLPAYALLLFWLLARGGSLLGRIHPRGNSVLVVFLGLAAICMVALPIPLWIAARPLPYGFPWDVYTGVTSHRSRYAELLPGYQALEELNEHTAPEDKVLFSGPFGQHLVAARTFEFPGWNAMLDRITRPADVAPFLRKNEIHYWVVDYCNANDIAWFRRLSVISNWWNPWRLRWGFSTIGVYDVSDNLHSSTMAEAGVTDLPPVVQGHPTVAAARARGWTSVTPQRLIEHDALGANHLSVAARTSLFHYLERPLGADFCEVRVKLRSNGSAPLLLTLAWRNINGKILTPQTHAPAWHTGGGRFEVVAFAPVPPGAQFGYLGLWTGSPVELTGGSIDYRLRLPEEQSGAGPVLDVLDPSRALSGTGFNVQPSGLSAIAILGQFDPSHELQVVMDGHVLPGVSKAPHLVTALVPPRVCATPAVCKVCVIDTSAGLRSNSLTLTVLKGIRPVAPELWRQRIPIEALRPASAVAGAAFGVQLSGGLMLHVSGAFHCGGRYAIVFDGQVLPATTNGTDTLGAVVPRGLLADAGNHQVFVIDSALMERSNALTLPLLPASKPAPSP